MSKGYKEIRKNLDGSYTFTDTRSVEEAHEDNLSRIRGLITAKITEAGYDEVWQRNAALGVIVQAEAEAGRVYITSLRAAYHDYKARLLAATRDEADAVQFVAPPVPEGM